MAEFGSLDPNDWREQEAQAGLALQQKDAAAKAAKERSWGDTARSVLNAPYSLAKSIGSLATAPSGPASDEAAMSPETFVNPLVKGLADTVVSGVTAPGEAMAGKIPQYGPEGHTSPEMVHRAFDTAAIAGGGSVAGTTEALPKLAADSAKAGAPLAAAERAPPFYSALEHAVAEHPQEVMPASQRLAMLKNTPGVKPDELKYTGTADMLAAKGDQPVTKAELQDHLEHNKVQLGEVTKGEMPEWSKLTPDQQYGVFDRFNDINGRPPMNGHVLQDWYDNIAEHSRLSGEETGIDGIMNPPRYAEYQIPGGKNYREKLLTLPEKTDAGLTGWDKITAGAQNYKSSHWDEPNVLAHLRMNDRDVASPAYAVQNTKSGNMSKPFATQAEANAYAESLPDSVFKNTRIMDTSEAKPSLHLEEIQSDWHQRGREKGYADSSPSLELPAGYTVEPVYLNGDRRFRVVGPQGYTAPSGYGDTEQAAIQNANRTLNAARVPDAPFKKNWHELALKRALHDAAEGGYERLSWTPGEAQAARYDLSKQVDQVKYNPKDRLFVAQKGGKSVIQKENVKPEDLPNIIGKDVARKLLESDTGSPMWKHSLEGQQLSVGGEGMKGFYDKIVPDYLNKVGKPHGVQVKQGYVRTEGPATPTVHYMDIPPSLKQQLLTKGMPLFEDNAAAAPIAAAAHAGEANVERAAANPRGAPGAGGGAGSLEEAQRASARAAGAVQPLAGLPQKPIILNGEHYIPGPIGRVHDVAKQYMEQTGRPYERIDAYHPLDVEHSTAIAKAFDEMKHEPSNPRVKASYEALAKETGDQYRAIKQSGLKVEPIRPDMPDPYAANPRLAAKDVAENNHLWFFPTEGGFGAEKGASSVEHPMLRPSGEMLNGKPLLNNDLFRIVHDYFGHLKEGNGFRAGGEDNAWRTHSKMYSEAARPAMTSETRGQNSWVNYGPHGETNRTASAADTHYSEQKVGLMPDWTMRDREPMTELKRAAGADPNTAPYPGAKYPQYAEQYPPVGPPTLTYKGSGKPVPKSDMPKGKQLERRLALPKSDPKAVFNAKENTPEAVAFQKDRDKIRKDMETQGYEPFFQPEERAHSNPADYPTARDMTQEALPAKQSTIEAWRAKYDTPEARDRLQKAYEAGKGIDSKDWYAMRQLEDQYVKHLGPEEGRKRFQMEFARTMAATTGGADPTSNLLLAHYMQWMAHRGEEAPVSHQLPFPLGGRYIGNNVEMARDIPKEGYDAGNAKRHDFENAFLGHTNKATTDEQMSNMIVPGMSQPEHYGIAAQVIHDAAKRNGVDPRQFQEVAWAGFKKLKTEAEGKKFSYKGPMISHVNDAIERTHRLTGMPRNEVVKRGLVKKEIPLYAGGVPMGSLNPQDDQ